MSAEPGNLAAFLESRSWEVIEVAADRIAPGGDIRESYSADKITQGRTRTPFQWREERWVCVSAFHDHLT